MPFWTHIKGHLPRPFEYTTINIDLVGPNLLLGTNEKKKYFMLPLILLIHLVLQIWLLSLKFTLWHPAFLFLY